MVTPPTPYLTDREREAQRNKGTEGPLGKDMSLLPALLEAALEAQVGSNQGGSPCLCPFFFPAACAGFSIPPSINQSQG